ncbi:site-specific DNA-methyltransferase [Agrobacterium tumefaciens]|uniref:site-specific DNA-methyltransferase n=1 Tax=Agrobacterium tumefaciens TaxID=358 RepID=UPI0015737079|nr:site-specific DNA-methyltransferase [Agrobacterium tumefaciens]WCK66831.1 site-specific DNA-methyltransferase [Agrobacterium tumefaciens]
MSKKTKLELTWIGKDERPKLEPRILIENPAKSYHAAARRSETDIFENMLIKGDNLLALKALRTQFEGEVKCIYIDPPYNTGAAFDHYDDGIEHSIWLSLIRERLEILWNLLDVADGSIWISIDDSEMAYLRVLCDELFGRSHFIASNVWQKRYSRENREAIGDVHEYILVYAKDPARFKTIRNKVPLTEEQSKVYRNPNLDPRGRWRTIPITAQAGHATADQFYEIVAPSGRVFRPSEGRCWGLAQRTFEKLRSEGRIYFGKDGDGQPNLIRYLSEVDGVVPWTWWPHEEVGHTDESKKEIHSLFGKADAFETPKPERLLERIIQIASNPGDLILDSFAGSGTTGAVAHKMGRRWIMVELGEHCDTHVRPRLKKVIDGEDKGGITEAVGWKGGGGFRYFDLAPSLLEQDKYGNWVISKDYNPAMLAEAMCKHMGYSYAPSQFAEEYWNHGYATEKSFIYVTTQQLTHEACRKISEDVGPERSLTVCCKAFSANPDSFENLIMVKIPSAILMQCEWGRDDYSLNIAKLPMVEDDDDEELDAASKADFAAPKRKKKVAAKDRFGDLSSLNLFGDLDSDADKSEG